MNNKNWHQKHRENFSFGNKLADSVAHGMGSWKFIIIQTLIVLIWMALNVVAFAYKWDPYPFILLNLVFSTQAAYAAPIIMMSQNRQNERDREQAQSDYSIARGTTAGFKKMKSIAPRLLISRLKLGLNAPRIPDNSLKLLPHAVSLFLLQ